MSEQMASEIPLFIMPKGSEDSSDRVKGIVQVLIVAGTEDDRQLVYDGLADLRHVSRWYYEEQIPAVPAKKRTGGRTIITLDSDQPHHRPVRRVKSIGHNTGRNNEPRHGMTTRYSQGQKDPSKSLSSKGSKDVEFSFGSYYSY